MAIREDVTVYHCDKCGKEIIGNYKIDNKLKNQAIGSCMYGFSDDEGVIADKGNLIVPKMPMSLYEYITFKIPGLIKDIDSTSIVNGGEKINISYKVDNIERGFCKECFQEISTEYFNHLDNFLTWARENKIIV